MLGYWNNHVATAEMIDAQGWLHTGDQARIQGRRVYITGRLKDVLVLSNGEKVPPADMEIAIGLDPLFEQVMIVGEGRPFLSALLVLNTDLWPGLAQEHGLDPDQPQSLRDRTLLAKLQKRVASQIRGFPGYAKIRRLTLTLQPWTVEDGMMTPTHKVRRKAVLEHFAAEIEAMYE
jgi:long-chain acyl-CoA synthetase